jgi:hypothetical protein
MSDAESDGDGFDRSHHDSEEEVESIVLILDIIDSPMSPNDTDLLIDSRISR